ncbi:Ig-like domain-containing protein [Arthrobacter sp. I2-34]|uniref:Ig-like domain-containing protein n=1 Tax=Arthrobacter hankyongi TaxID=2904801 RepID=A0ABS9L7S2_9MICC|nr:Ig-like domain-containing protein [Arthrobacter hankyongi]MCG2622714.1 Ig-like domain-containing protein [Arthrobacter hankyongi]
MSAKHLLCTAATAVLLAGALTPLGLAPARAELAGRGPVDPQNGFPSWYSDGTVKLQLCYTAEPGCLSTPPNSGPASYPDNFPEEAFWYAAEASGGSLRLYQAALEGAHLNGPVVPGEQIGFARLRFRLKDLVPGADYTITHPYGVQVVTAEDDGTVYETFDAGVCAPTRTTPCDWDGVGEAFLGDYELGSTATFLRQIGAPAGKLGDPNVPAPVTGAPSGNNFVTVAGPNAGGRGIDTLTVDTFAVQGVLFEGDDGAPGTPDLTDASDSGRSAADNITNVATPEFTGSLPGPDGGTVELLLDGAAEAVASGTSAGGTYTVQLAAPLASGVHKVQARTANPAYSADPEAPSEPSVPQYLTSPALTFTVDTTAPDAAVTAPFPSNPSLDNTPTFHFSANEAGARFECQLLPSNSEWDPTCTSPTTYDAQANGSYTFNVRATDVAGNVGAMASRNLRIGPADTIAPTVSSREPASAATEVGLDSSISVNFSEDVLGVSAETFTLKDPAGTAVDASVDYDPLTGRAVLDPSATLAAGTVYTATLSGGTGAIRDAAGLPLATVSWSFTTAAAPTVTARTPGAGATGVPVGSSITATFSKAVTGLGAATFTLKNAAGTAVPATVSYDGASRVATLKPTAPLAAAATYTATLSGGAAAIRATADLPLATAGWSFTTAAAPTVTGRTPASGAMAVAADGNITATFGKDVTGLDSTSFTLKTATGTSVPAAVSYNAATRTATLNPTANLAADTRYTATLTGAIRDTIGTPLAATGWSFTTGAAPAVTAKAPGTNALAVPQTGNVTVTFSEPVQGITASTFRITKASTGAAIAATVTRNGTTNQWILNPGTTLAADTRYTVSLTGGSTAVRDRAGNPLAGTSWPFTTGPAPTVTARTPGTNATAVPRTGNITVTFSEPVTGLTSSTFKIKRASTGAAVAATVTRRGSTNQWILNPNATLAANTKYTVTLSGGGTAIRDGAGNPFRTGSWSFTTGTR